MPKLKGHTIDCKYVIKVIDFLEGIDDFEIVEMPIISVDTGLWEAW